MLKINKKLFPELEKNRRKIKAKKNKKIRQKMTKNVERTKNTFLILI